MDVMKNCQTCEFNFNGTCAEGGDVYKYGEQITDDKKTCSAWGAGFDYFMEVTNKAPRFLREKFEDCRISFNKMLELLEADTTGTGVELNIFDAIKTVYKISMVDIAVLMDVSFGVVYRAKTKGIPPKRMQQFSNILCIPEELLLNVTTLDFGKLMKCKEKFEASSTLNARLNAMPEWKFKLANEISSFYLHCPIHISTSIARVDKMYWSPSVSIDEYTESEKILINYLNRKGKKGKPPVYQVEYSLDLACKPHLRILAPNPKVSS